LSYHAAYSAFKKLLSEHGFNPRLYGLHSMRIGAATDAMYGGIPHHIIDKQARWKNPNTKFTYLRVKDKEFVQELSGKKI